VYVRHQHGTSTFSLQQIERLDERRYCVRLNDAPHLALNRLEVSRMHGREIVVAPPPNLPRSAGPPDLLHLGLQVYARDGAQRRRLGTIVSTGGLARSDAFGQKFTSPEPTLRLSNNGPTLAPGQELEVTRLRLGQDQVVIPAWSAP
jgi:hypothetical protein